MARGATPQECLAELMSKATGLCRAKGGSMHLTKASVGMLGSYAIVGSHLPMAAGAAWSAKLRGTDQVAVAFFGDGATNIGAFHEALNLAAVWKLPVLFVCENNLYMEYTPMPALTESPPRSSTATTSSWYGGSWPRRPTERAAATGRA
jgi:pyruvate dehydrogenase E1 component alpha subunit